MYHGVIIIGRPAESPEQITDSKVRLHVVSVSGGDEKHRTVWFTVFANGRSALTRRALKKGQHVLIGGVIEARPVPSGAILVGPAVARKPNRAA